MTNSIAALLLTLAVAGLAAAGTVSPGLELQMSAMDGDDPIKVLVVLKDQVDVQSMDLDLHASKAPMADRHRIVLESLQKTAERTQRSLLADLEAAKADGPVRGYTPHWLINAVVVVTTVDGVKTLALRDDVDVIEPDLQVELIEPTSTLALTDDHEPIGITPGVVSVGARRVWDELGVDGGGAIVGILDTGVDGTHPALAGSWRGNDVPASESWFDAAGLGDDVPVDRHFHGTHVMGTIVGLAPGDTIGVAPGAQWIASNVIRAPAIGEDFDNAVIASLEFMADPDGNPWTVDDMPDVVQNSWGVNENIEGYFECDNRWWQAIDACEASGVVLTWSAGNEGSAYGSMRSPADRATTAWNSFSVGSVNHTPPFDISGFSSRGPSKCGGQYATKPEIMAPGEEIVSTVPDGGYGILSGTSMAGPHVAGIIALMRAANPEADVLTIKQTLLETAVDMALPGDDDASGHGYIDGFAAVSAVMEGFGTFAGGVTDADSAVPIGDALITLISPGLQTRHVTTDESGNYLIMLPPGQWLVQVEAFGYLDRTDVVVDIASDQTSTRIISMTAAPTDRVYGYVTDDTGEPVRNAQVRAVGTPVPPAVSDAFGAYEMILPLDDHYLLQADAYGMATLQADVQPFDMETHLDFQLTRLTLENFETGGFALMPWQHPGNIPWTVDGSTSFEGHYSARSGAISNNGFTFLTVQAEVLTPGEIQFHYKVSSEESWDYLIFYVDGQEKARWSGYKGWASFSYPVDVGAHQFMWGYLKDGANSNNDDCAWIDFVIFPTVAPPAFPLAAWSETSVVDHLNTGDTVSSVMTLSNDGEIALQWSLEAVMAPPRSAWAGPLPPDGPYKDQIEVDPSHGDLLGDGGPNAAGYSWIDSTDPAGPVFDWVEIFSVGTELDLSDDEMATVPIGFPFTFFGETYEEVKVCSNGWLSFTSTSTSNANTPVPSPVPPNDMIAVFWDDLDPTFEGNVYAHQDLENDRLIVEWEAVPYYGTTRYQTFQAHLYADGTILCQYQEINDRHSATIGLEGPDAATYLAVAHNEPFIQDGMAILYTFVPPPLPWLTVDATSGLIPPGGTQDITVSFDATDVLDGRYSGHLLIETNDPVNTRIIVPASLFVGTGTGVDEDVPQRFSLGAAVPNPFNPSTEIAFAVPAGGAHVKLEVYDLAGRLVKRLVDEHRDPGRYTTVWRGDDERGRRTASGTYVYRLGAGDFTATRKMVLLK